MKLFKEEVDFKRVLQKDNLEMLKALKGAFTVGDATIENICPIKNYVDYSQEKMMLQYMLHYLGDNVLNVNINDHTLLAKTNQMDIRDLLKLFTTGHITTKNVEDLGRLYVINRTHADPIEVMLGNVYVKDIVEKFIERKIVIVSPIQDANQGVNLITIGPDYLEYIHFIYILISMIQPLYVSTVYVDDNKSNRILNAITTNFDLPSKSFMNSKLPMFDMDDLIVYEQMLDSYVPLEDINRSNSELNSELVQRAIYFSEEVSVAITDKVKVNPLSIHDVVEHIDDKEIHHTLGSYQLAYNTLSGHDAVHKYSGIHLDIRAAFYPIAKQVGKVTKLLSDKAGWNKYRVFGDMRYDLFKKLYLIVSTCPYFFQNVTELKCIVDKRDNDFDHFRSYELYVRQVLVSIFKFEKKDN